MHKIEKWIKFCLWKKMPCANPVVFVFCCSFMCGDAYHCPTSCETIKKWLVKCQDDSESANYITANTKDVSIDHCVCFFLNLFCCSAVSKLSCLYWEEWWLQSHGETCYTFMQNIMKLPVHLCRVVLNVDMVSHFLHQCGSYNTCSITEFCWLCMGGKFKCMKICKYILLIF